MRQSRFILKISHQFHTGLTPASPHFYKFTSIRGRLVLIDKGGIFMAFLGLEWYWWLVIAAVLTVSVPFKIKFMKRQCRREQEKKKELHGKWGDDE